MVTAGDLAGLSILSNENGCRRFIMATRNQPSTRFREEIGIVSPWVFFFAALAFVSVFVL